MTDKEFLAKIERGEMALDYVMIGTSGMYQKETTKVLLLAQKGALYQQLLDECANELKTCCDDSCKGNIYCKAYKAEVIEP